MNSDRYTTGEPSDRYHTEPSDHPSAKPTLVLSDHPRVESKLRDELAAADLAFAIERAAFTLLSDATETLTADLRAAVRAVDAREADAQTVRTYVQDALDTFNNTFKRSE